VNHPPCTAFARTGRFYPRERPGASSHTAGSPMGLRGTERDCGTRLFPYGIVSRRLIPSRHGAASEYGSGTLGFGRGGLSAVSPKLGITAVPGCALQGATARFMRISPTHVGMVRSGPRNCSPRMWGWTVHVHVAGDHVLSEPHACGDGPTSGTFQGEISQRTPRMWGVPSLGGFVSVPGSRE